MTDDFVLNLILWALLAFSIVYIGGLLRVRLLFGVELVKLPSGSGLVLRIGWTRNVQSHPQAH